MHVGLAVLVVTLFIAFGERINEMNFNFQPSDVLLLIFLLGLVIHANKNRFYEQWGKFKRERSRRKLLYSNWYDELRENLEKKN